MRYPLYDRSGVEEEGDVQPIGHSTTAPPPPQGDIHVCHAGSCVARGAEAVLTEIEELVSGVGGKCAVRPSGCLGYCDAAPNAVVIERGARGLDPSNVHVRINSLEASAKIVHQATGTRPALESPAMRERLAGLRAMRSRQRAVECHKWNAALHGLAEQAAQRPALRGELAALLRKAGFPDGMDASALAAATMPDAIDNYSPWSVESVTPVTKHTALFRLVSKNVKRGTPHPRGRGVMPDPKTWHTTLAAEVGPNDEGPLPWIERDYTPISSAKEWEQGRCEILIKLYPGTGGATSWLQRAAPTRLRLSKPHATLRVPSLVVEGRGFQPASVLLLLAGTGVVALPQLLAHRDPTRQLGISTPRHAQLKLPIDLLYSCRQDDVLMIPQLAQWCRDGGEASGEARGVRNCTLLLTPPAATTAEPPFPTVQTGDVAEAEDLLQGLANVELLRARLSPSVVTEALARMPKPCRIVVSGPGGFNSAARSMLAELMVDVDEQVTILSA